MEFTTSKAISPYQPVGTPKTTAEAILTQANLLFSQRGYDAVSLQAIATACRIRKSSLFHYVKSKAELVERVLQRVRNDYQLNVFTQAKITKDVNLTRWFDNLNHFFLTQPTSKLAVTLAASAQIAVIGQQLQAYFTQWHTELLALLKPHLEHATAEMFSQESIERLHGALLMSHVYADDRYIKRCCQQLQARYQTLLINQPTSM